jgi:hypothetical protein
MNYGNNGNGQQQKRLPAPGKCWLRKFDGKGDPNKPAWKGEMTTPDGTTYSLSLWPQPPKTMPDGRVLPEALRGAVDEYRTQGQAPAPQQQPVQPHTYPQPHGNGGYAPHPQQWQQPPQQQWQQLSQQQPQQGGIAQPPYPPSAAPPQQQQHVLQPSQSPQNVGWQQPPQNGGFQGGGQEGRCPVLDRCEGGCWETLRNDFIPY